MPDPLVPVRSLSAREAELMAWLESERRATVTPKEVAAAFGWKPTTIWNVLSRLNRKGWLIRTARGRYETVLAETGGYALPNPWAALSMWDQPYYVGFQSAAYEHGLTPDRPGAVQVCVTQGARRPLAWRTFPIVLVHLRSFSRDGTREEERHGFPIWIASPEVVLIDGAVVLSRIGGMPGLARIVDRARGEVDWRAVVALSAKTKRGHVALRRLAALLKVTADEVPTALDRAAAAAARGRSPFFLGERRIFGTGGETLRRYAVINNINTEALQEEVRR